MMVRPLEFVKEDPHSSVKALKSPPTPTFTRPRLSLQRLSMTQWKDSRETLGGGLLTMLIISWFWSSRALLCRKAIMLLWGFYLRPIAVISDLVWLNKYRHLWSRSVYVSRSCTALQWFMFSWINCMRSMLGQHHCIRRGIFRCLPDASLPFYQQRRTWNILGAS